jgi:phenylalanyl-tRNA synthetase beta chain
MLISHNWLQSYFKNPEKLPAPKEVAEILTMHALEVDSLEEKDGDHIYEVKMTADRGPYMYGLRYVALELSLIIPELEISDEIRFDISDKDLESAKVKVNHELVHASLKDLCPVYSLTKIENVTNIESPDFIKKSLMAIGQNTKSLLVDLTNFVMFDMGQPLHVFDADKVEGQIRVDLSKEGETITILGGKEIKLDTNTLVIRDDAGILAIAGVKGGIKAEVDGNTKNVYLESANFNQTVVRKTARSLNLLNDSSKRFEQGLNKERFLLGVQDYLHLLSWYDKEVIVHESEVSDELGQVISKDDKRTIDIDIDKLARMVDANNQDIPAQLVIFVEHILPKTGAVVTKKDEKNYTVTAPYHRSDMQLDVDIADEFLRNKNYDSLAYDEHFKDTVQASEGLKSPADKLIYNIRKFFIDRGFDEIILHTLVDTKMNPSAVRLENSLTADRDSLRSDLNNYFNIAMMINIQHIDLVGKKIIKLFEIGKVFEAIEGDKLDLKEFQALTYGMLSAKGRVSKEDFKLEKEKLKKDFEDTFSPYFENFKFDGDTMSLDSDFHFFTGVSLINLQNLESIKLDQDLSKNRNRLIDNKKYRKASTYPAMSRDIAFFVEDSLGKSEDDIENLIKAEVAKQPLIENHFRFDIFKKDGKTSYAYRFVFQSYEKTLTEEETKGVMGEIARVLASQGFDIR